MANPDQAFQDLLDKMSKVNDVLSAVGKSATASATAERIARERNTAQMIKAMKEELGYNDKLAKQTIKKIEQEEKAIKQEAEKIEQTKRNQEIQDRIDSERANATKKLITDLKAFASGSISASQSIYNSDQAFAAVKPTLDVLGSAVKAVSGAFAGLFTGIPILGSFFSGADKLIGPAVDLSVQVMQAQIDNAQKFVNTYSSLSKIGLTFGGAVEQMRTSAATAGMSLDSYSKFLTTNVENLSLLGGTLEQGASRVTKFGATIANNNPKLLAMYGSLEALQGGTADYASLLARSGIDLNRSDKDLISGAKEYLVNMKELSALTGKSAEELKKSEEARMQSAAYSLQLTKMDDVKRANTQNAMEMTQKNYGEAAAKYAQEFIATNGKVTSEGALLFKSMYPEIANTVDRTLSVTGQTADQFKRSQAEIIESSRDAIKKEVTSRENLLQLQAGGGAGDAYLDALNKTAAAVLKSQTSQSEAVEANAKLEKERNAKITEGTASFANAIVGLNRFKMKIDEQTENNLPRIGKVVDGLLKVQDQINELFGKNITNAVNKAVDALIKLANALNGTTPTIAPDGKTSLLPPKPGTEGTAPQATTGGGAATGGMKGGLRRRGVATESGLKIKSAESTGGGEHTERLQQIAEIIHEKLGGDYKYFSAFNDMSHDGSSKHTQGLALDLVLNDRKKYAEVAAMIRDIPGVASVLDEANFPRPTTKGDHIHVEAHAEKLAKGGITRGPSIAGEAGPEAVIPLPDGRSIPVKMDMSEMVSKLEEMISLLRDQRDNSEKLLYATQ